MLQYYILTKINNKMKDSNSKSKERWEVAEEYFAKELEINLAQHIADERNFKYKLEIYQRNFPEFIYGSPTTIKTSGQDEETNTGPSGTTEEEEEQIEESQEFKGGDQEEKEPQTIQK